MCACVVSPSGAYTLFCSGFPGAYAQWHSLYRRYHFVKLNDESDSYPFWPGTSRFPLAKSNAAQITRLAGTVRFLAPINGFPNVASKVSGIGR